MGNYFEKKGEKYFAKSSTELSAKNLVPQTAEKDPVGRFKDDLANRSATYSAGQYKVVVKRYAAKRD